MNKFIENFHKNIAKQYVDRYIDDSPVSAGMLVLEHQEQIDRDTLRGEIDAEFNRRGLYFDINLNDWV